MAMRVTGFTLTLPSGSAATCSTATNDVAAMAAYGLEQASGYTHQAIRLRHRLNGTIWDVSGTDRHGTTRQARLHIHTSPANEQPTA